ncbi:MAG: DNA adenine methylase [Bacteroidales bacterium]|nr:DNA adenine methylase [Bacteroidales bacterium]
MAYKASAINNRRYLGNKYKLLPFISKVVNENCTNVEIFADLFAGTGAVSSAFHDKIIITNDLLYSNYICNVAWFGSEQFDKEKIESIILEYNLSDPVEENYMSINFADTFFSRKDCVKIGFVRDDIEKKFNSAIINKRERALLITSLLYAMDRIANTCGHYDAYRQGVEYDKHLELCYPDASNDNNSQNKCYNMDINRLVDDIYADLVYLDPPYNSRQYCDAYHLLENVARWEKPKVKGVARKMDRSNLKSNYCTRLATETFEDLIDKLNCRYILLSYNNMSNKGNERSNAKISDDDIFRILAAKGTVKIFSEAYKPFMAGKSNIRGNEERLFLCKCK